MNRYVLGAAALSFVLGCASQPASKAPPSQTSSNELLRDASTAPATRPANLLKSGVYAWGDLPVRKTASGEQRAGFRSPTATLDELEMHITTVRPGQRSHAPHRHPHEEMMFIKEGEIEAIVNDQTFAMPAGSVLFVAPMDLHGLRNAGTTDATYFVLTWKTPRTAPATRPAR